MTYFAKTETAERHVALTCVDTVLSTVGSLRHSPGGGSSVRNVDHRPTARAVCAASSSSLSCDEDDTSELDDRLPFWEQFQLGRKPGAECPKGNR